MRKREILFIYASGLAELLFASLCFSVCCLIGIQVLSQMVASEIDASSALLFFWQSIVLLALWPGQTFWTIRRETAAGISHSVIGVPTEDDIVCMNRITARQRSGNRVQR